jgi:hypothetical protein
VSPITARAALIRLASVGTERNIEAVREAARATRLQLRILKAGGESENPQSILPGRCGNGPNESGPPSDQQIVRVGIECSF